MPYWHPNLTITLISDSPKLNLKGMMPVTIPCAFFCLFNYRALYTLFLSLRHPLFSWLTIPNPDIQLTGERDESGQNTFYNPIIYPNDFWHLRMYQSCPHPLPLCPLLQPYRLLLDTISLLLLTLLQVNKSSKSTLHILPPLQKSSSYR